MHYEQSDVYLKLLTYRAIVVVFMFYSIVVYQSLIQILLWFLPSRQPLVLVHSSIVRTFAKT